MNTDFPDTDTIRTILMLATRAPSIYNSQPWHWRVRDEKLDLYVDAGLRLPSTDPDGRDLILSCGAALNHCVVALAAMGWRARVPRPSRDDRNIPVRRGSGRRDAGCGHTATANRPPKL
jgi:hypothetical protein